MAKQFFLHHMNSGRRMFALLAVSIMAVVLAFALSACGKAAETPNVSAITKSQNDAADETDGLILNASNASGPKVKVTNASGKTITQLTFSSSDQTLTSVAAMQADQTWGDGVAATIVIPDAYASIESSNADSAATNAATDGSDATGQDLALQGYQLEITFDDASVATLHSVTLTSLTDLQIQSEGTVAYLSYTDETGTVVTTLAAEQAIVTAAEAKAKADAEAATAAEAESTAAANSGSSNTASTSSGSKNSSSSNSNSNSSSSNSNSSSSNSKSSGSGSTGSTGGSGSTGSSGSSGSSGSTGSSGSSSQSSDECVSDLLLR
jgi:hypothetical protein